MRLRENLSSFPGNPGLYVMSINKEDNMSGWECRRCSERVEEQFEICWNCGANKEGEIPAEFESEFVEEKASTEEAIDDSKYRLFTGCLLVILVLICLAGGFVHLTGSLKLSGCFGLVVYILVFTGLLILTAGLISLLVKGGEEPLNDEEKLKRLLAEEVICPYCLKENRVTSHFCVNCTTPLTSHAAIDPLGQIHATGDTYRKAKNHPTKFLVILGLWVHFGSQIVFPLCTLLPAPNLVNTSDNIPSTLNLVFVVPVVIIIYSLILWTATKNYYIYRKREKII